MLVSSPRRAPSGLDSLLTPQQELQSQKSEVWRREALLRKVNTTCPYHTYNLLVTHAAISQVGAVSRASTSWVPFLVLSCTTTLLSWVMFMFFFFSSF